MAEYKTLYRPEGGWQEIKEPSKADSMIISIASISLAIVGSVFLIPIYYVKGVVSLNRKLRCD